MEGSGVGGGGNLGSELVLQEGSFYPCGGLLVVLGTVGKRSVCEQTGGVIRAVLRSLSSKARCGLSVVPPELQVLPLVPRAKPMRASRGSLCFLFSRFPFQLCERTILEVPKFQRQEAGAVCLLFHLGIQLHHLPEVVSVTDPGSGCFTAFHGLVGSIKIREGAGDN